MVREGNVERRRKEERKMERGERKRSDNKKLEFRSSSNLMRLRERNRLSGKKIAVV